jgi:hypothetical protein
VSLAASLPARSVVPPAESARLSDAQEARRLIDKGRQLRSAGDRANSLAAFRQAVESDPTNATATSNAVTITCTWSRSQRRARRLSAALSLPPTASLRSSGSAIPFATSNSLTMLSAHSGGSWSRAMAGRRWDLATP